LEKSATDQHGHAVVALRQAIYTISFNWRL